MIPYSVKDLKIDEPKVNEKAKSKVVKEILTEMPEIIINYFKNNPKVVVDTARYYTTLI